MLSLANQMRLNVGKQPLSTHNGALHSLLYAIYADKRKYEAPRILQRRRPGIHWRDHQRPNCAVL
jgi:hypothetical protein